MMAHRILVVVDDPSVREAVRAFLVEKGLSVTNAHSGEQALEVYEQERPDVVLLDVRMPGKDGLATLRELKAHDLAAAVIMLTTIVDEPLAKQARAEGALEYLTKPIDFNYLEVALQTVIASLGAGA